MAPDEELAVAAQADPHAFSPLYERYLRRVYRYCFLRLGKKEAAEDVAGTVFLKALEGIAQYRGGGFAPWLYRIARNAAIDFQRRHRPTEPVDAEVDPVDPAPTPEDLALIRDEVAALRSALTLLPQDQRTVLELQLAGWSGEQIASAMGRTEGAVKMLRYRAVDRMRSLLIRD